jgi:sugar phosphate isomerase/epimerase
MFYSGIADEAGKPIATQIQAHRELGWKHIELRQVNELSGIAYAGEDEFKRIHEQLADADIQVSCFASAIANWARDVTGPFEKDIDELRRAIPKMQAMQTPFIRIMAYANEKGLSDAEWRKESIRRLKELARMAEDGGVVMVLENCHGWASQSPTNMTATLGEVDSPALKMVFDTGNWTRDDHTSYEWYRQIDREQIVYVHVKDLDRSGGATWPGQGDSGVEEILCDLFAHGYDGGISIEPHVAAVVHTGAESDPGVMFDSYVKYGRMTMDLVERAKEG